MDRVKKRLAYLLAMVLLLALLAPAAPAVTAFAATKNPITELGVKKLPEGNTIKVGEVFNFDPDIIATERGKGKSTGVVWWEINARTNTAGVSSSRWGYVYPVYAGSFEIRALAFANTKDLNAWKAARKANGYVAEEAVTASYATAMTDWVKIDVVSDTEGYAVARSQYQLGLALKNRKVKEIHIQTDKSICFTIGRKSYVQRTLVVDAPNAEVENAGRFAQINIKQIKASTFTEKAYGNRFYVTAPDARIVFLDNARTNEVVFEPGETAETNRLTLVGEGGMLSELDVKAAGNVDIVGSIFADRAGKAVVVNVAEEAAGTSIQTDAALEVNTAADVAVTVNKTEEGETVQGKRKTVINMEKAVKVSVDGTAADGTTVVVKDGAKGSEIASDAALVIVANADVTLNLTENAAGTTVTKGENVKVDLSAESKVDGVSITDVNGTVETIKPGEDSPEVTIAPSATPVPTTAPSGGSSGGWIPPVTTSTPAPTAVPTSGASYTLDGKTTGVSFASGSKEAVVALPADSSSKTVTLTVNGNSVRKALVVGVNAVSIGEYTVKFIVPVESVKISASLSDVKISTVSGSAVTGSAILVVKVKDDLSAFTADPDFDVSYEWKIGDTVTPDISGTVYQKAVEVAVNGNLITYAEAGAYSVAVKVNHSKAGEALTMKSGSLKIDFRMQEGEEPEITPTPIPTPVVDWFAEKGLELSPQGNFGFVTSVENDEQTATVDQIYVPANIVITESTEGVKEGYKKVTAVVYLNTENLWESAGNIWSVHISAFDRYTGTSFAPFAREDYLPSPPLTNDGGVETSATYSMTIQHGEKTYDISGEAVSRYNQSTYMTTINIVCPVDYDGTVFQVGASSPELNQKVLGLGLEEGQTYTVDMLPYSGEDYFYFSKMNSEYNDEYCGLYQKDLESEYAEVLIYSISGGTLVGEIRGEVLLGGDGNTGIIYGENIDGATVRAKLVKAGEEAAVTLDKMINHFSIGRYRIAAFNPQKDPKIVPTSVSAKCAMLENEGGETGGSNARVILSARFDEAFNPQYQAELEGVSYYRVSYGIRWCKPDGKVVAEVSWDPEKQLWYGGAAYDGDFSVPMMWRTVENGAIKDISYYYGSKPSSDADWIEPGKGVDCAVELPVSQASDIDGYYASVVFYVSDAATRSWWVLNEKKVIENTIDGGKISVETAN